MLESQTGCSEACAAGKVRKGDSGPQEACPGTQILVDLQSWLCHPLAICFQTKDFSFLDLSLFTCKMGILIPNSQKVIKVNEIIYLACGRLFNVAIFCHSYYK